MKCQSCSNIYEGNFCPNCGEKRFDVHSLSIKHFFEEVLEGIVHFDNKFIRTVKVLITKPGQLSLDYVEGKRVRYMKPIQFFVVVNLIFFFFTMANAFHQPLSSYLHYGNFTRFHTREIVQAHLKKKSLTLQEYALMFDQKMAADSKEFLFIFIPFYALVFALLFAFKKKPIVTHLVFSTYFMAFIPFWFLISYFVLALPYWLITRIDYSPWFDNFMSRITQIVIFVYLFFATRKNYSTP
jgi:hypothetical protein